MRRLCAASLAIASLLALAPAAKAEFGLKDIEISFTDSEGSVATQAGSHPFAMKTSFKVNTVEREGGIFADGAARDLDVSLPQGFTGNPKATPQCSTLDFLNVKEELPACSDSSAVGFIKVTIGAFLGTPTESGHLPVYNLEPAPGVAAKLGFWVLTVPITVELRANPEPPYNVIATQRNIPQAVDFYAVNELVVWGTPADPAHDPLRGHCAKKGGSCPANIAQRPFMTLPRSCTGPLLSTFTVSSWWSGDHLNPGPSTTFSEATETPGMSDCAKLGFAPQSAALPSTDHAESPTGLNFNLDVTDEGLSSPTGLAHSDMKRTVVTLPEGVTINPSVAEGLLTCTPAQYALEKLDSRPGEGCPEASKVGTVEVETPVFEGEILRGSVFVAQQDDPATTAKGAENPFDSLIALYLVIRSPERGVIVKVPGKVEPDPQSGQLVSVFDDIPQQPVSHLRLRLREGGRSPLISPNECGTHTTLAELTPWARPNETLSTTSSFEIAAGVGGGPCPTGGVPPFQPGFTAGSLNNNAASYSPFYMRLTRRDGDQDMTKFSSVLPPGVVGKLAGVGKCSDQEIAQAKAKTGRQELASPSCPPNSKIGRTLAGAGVGSQLTYVPGSLYMAGPYNGAPLSVVAITPAVAGPFDAGTVVVREALRIDPLTAEVEVDGDASDPIPHILQGIPLKVRDLRVYVDRENFVLNPTSCDPSKAKATLFGSFLDVFSPADDVPVGLESRYQAANCRNLGFKPRLSLQLKGGTKRGGHPALRGVFKPRPGDANLSRLVLRLPRSAFLDQAHIRTICTRVQFAASSCPPGAIYGKATAWSPLLDEPLSGPVYLRSSDNNLPDFVAHLHGLVDVEAVARIDSAGGGIRATFPIVPDAPLSKVVVEMQGGKKGLIVNSRDLCASKSRADLRMSAHNAKRHRARVVVRAVGCGGKR